jgi:hypothetical protein
LLQKISEELNILCAFPTLFLCLRCSFFYLIKICSGKKWGSEEFLFPCNEIQDAGTNEGGESACPPMPPLR